MRLNFKYMGIKSIILLVCLNVKAFELVCKTSDQKIPHQIEFKISNDIVEIKEAWNGPFKTTDNYIGHVVLNPHHFYLIDFEFKGIPSGVSNRQHTFAKIIFNYEQNTAKIYFTGFLSPQNDGSQIMNCGI